MPNTPSSPEQKLLNLWQRFGQSAIGRKIFNRLIGLNIPYTGSIKPQILELSPGHCKVKLRDKRAVRNHLRSVHALALANLGELASGFAMTAALSRNTRAIVTHLEIDYLKKARGELIAIGEAEPPQTVSERTEVEVQANIYDSENDVVAQTRVTWLLSPRENQASEEGTT